MSDGITYYLLNQLIPSNLQNINKFQEQDFHQQDPFVRII